MRILASIFGVVLVGGVLVCLAVAEELPLRSLSQPSLIEQIAYESEASENNQDETKTESNGSKEKNGPFVDETPPKPLNLPYEENEKTSDFESGKSFGCGAAACNDGCGTAACNDGCGTRSRFGGCGARCGGCSECKLGKPWQLPRSCFFQRNNILWGGWIQQGITFNDQSPTNRFNGPVATNDRDSEYQMNQLWLYLMRPTNTGGHGFDIGGRIDIVYGSDFRFGINNGLENRINSVDQSYGLVIPQMYLEVAINNLTVKAGHFAAILDYEAIPAVANPFYSHSYGYGYGVPQLVTGVLGDYKLGENLSVQAGFHRGWMMFEDINESLDFIGGVKWQSSDQRTSLALAASVGPQFPLNDDDNRFVYSFVAQQQITKQLKYVMVHNYGYEENTNFRTGENADWYGINQYLQYQINPCWSINARFEWFRDDDGARIWGVPNAIPGVRTWDGAPGFAGDFLELTLGVNWRPHANLLVRPEVRWDWYDGSTNLAGDLPFDDGNSDDQFLFGVDMIVTF